MKTSETGLSLIKKFEGLRLSSYYCPSNVLSVGYGRTGTGVYEGMTITEAQADLFLLEDVVRFEEAINTLVEVDLNQNEFDALVSFAFNCGVSALKESSLLRRLNAGEEKGSVFREELPRWVNGSNGLLPGLIMRRSAELELACSSPAVSPEYFLDNAAKYYKELPHQKEAWRALEDMLSPELLTMFKNAYRTSQKPVKEDGNPLSVPYFYQRDSKTGQGERMCFSSSMAMAMDYLDPDAIEGDDDWYLHEVFKFGDTVSSTAQIAAAESLGFNAVFKTGLDADALEAQIDRGIPIPIGILHKGTIDRPSGGGHWITAIGYDETNFVVHDPFGQLDLIGGGYPKGRWFIFLGRWYFISIYDRYSNYTYDY